MLQPTTLPAGSSLVSVFIQAAALVVATTIGGLIGWLATRKKQLPEIHETEANTELARVQTTHNLAETLRTVSAQLLETTEALNEAARRIHADEMEKTILSDEVERARREGFLQRQEQGGTGPNPAA